MALDYTQEDVASLAGLKPSAVSHFETGHRLPSFENLRDLVIVLKVSADFLLDIPRPPGVMSLYRRKRLWFRLRVTCATPGLISVGDRV